MYINGVLHKLNTVTGAIEPVTLTANAVQTTETREERIARESSAWLAEFAEVI